MLAENGRQASTGNGHQVSVGNGHQQTMGISRYNGHQGIYFLKHLLIKIAKNVSYLFMQLICK